MSLVEKLVSIQQQLRLSNRGFARKLQLSHDLWSKTRAGKLPVGHTLLRRVAITFPELKDDLVAHLASPLTSDTASNDPQP